QYDNGFDPNRPTGEDILIESNNNFVNFAGGINFRLQSLASNQLTYPQLNRSKLDFGIGIFNLTGPNQSFVAEVDDPLPVRLSPYVFGTMMVSPKVDLVGRTNVQIQEESLEGLIGLGVKYHLMSFPKPTLAFQAGVNLRFQDLTDAYAPTFDVFYDNWRFSFSYDVNVSAFNVATGRNGGPEFSIRYLFKSVPSLNPDDCRLL
ncbi:MAG: type IX secretion system membrane protein PorP/SprF, partial [Bacteroidota bacterium]